MRKNTILLVMMAVLFSACSVEKNTPLSRSYHKTKVKYNIYYNGHTAYEEGMEATAQACQDDYTTDVIYLYPVSDHKAAEAAKSKMDRTIEKCRKCIKLHSIKKKPKPDPKKRSDPAYRAWLEQEEFNPAMPDAWLLLAKSEFHKGDFLGSIGTFKYIEKHFAYDKDVVAQCQLWQARAYAEIDWVYEAQQLVDNVRQDDLKRKHASLYSSAAAVVRIKSGMYREAIPHVRIALQDEKRSGNRPRAYFVLGQLYETQKQKAAAIDCYKQVIKLNPKDLALDFNAELRLAELQANAASVKKLEKMIKQPKHKDHLDQLYGAIGNIYLHQGDTAKALENYKKAAEESTANGIDKAMILVRAADLYYDKPDYPNAGACYQDASTILTSEHPDYRRVNKRAEVLQGLITDVNTIELQDSLQHLSTLSEEKQMEVVQRIIADLEAAEAAEKEAAEQAERAAKNGDDGSLQGVNTSQMIGGGGGAAAAWYFYNTNLLRQGKQEFARRWGNRTLEDNWRRSVKSAGTMPMPDEDDAEQDEDAARQDSASVSTDSVVVKSPISTDIHDPQYYLQQIPRTEADFRASDSLIVLAMADMVGIYETQLEDHALAEKTVNELRTRFPDFNGLLGIYYEQYLSALRRDDAVAQEEYKQAILSKYPDSEEARIVNDPQYFARLKRMAAEQDSIYEATYKAYRAGEWSTVKSNKQYAATNYPMSPLMPKFYFLNAVATAKADGQTAFADALRELVEAYPESDMGTMSKDMLAMMNEGMESKKGGSVDNLSAARTELQEAEAEAESADETEQIERYDRIWLVIPADEKALGNLLYEVALYNFSQFLIKDFDLRAETSYGKGQMAVEISGFDSADEREWYIGLLQQAMPEVRIER